MTRIGLIAFIASVLLAPTPIALAEEAHTHGEGALNIAIDSEGALIEVAIPADDLVGFEYEPSSQQEKQAVNDALEALEAEDLFTFNAEAGCVRSSVHADFEVEGDHAEFHAELEFDCADSGAISSLSTTYFTLFPDTHELDVQVSTNAGSAGFEWEAEESSVTL